MSSPTLNISIIGLGLIGASLALALKQNSRNYNVHILGYSRRSETCSAALQQGVIDSAAMDLRSCVTNIDLIVIATPVLKIRDIFRVISSDVKPGCIITDVGSTKADVVRWADEFLPEGVNFIGGHPMAGKETSGLEQAEPELFEGCIYCLSPSPRASNGALEMLAGLVQSIGAIPLIIDAHVHDSLVAAVSHLPILLSSAFVSATTGTPQWPDMAKLAASGYRDMSRLASGNPDMNRDICLTNRDSILQWIDIYIDELKKYRLVIANDDSENTFNMLYQAKQARDIWAQEDKR